MALAEVLTTVPETCLGEKIKNDVKPTMTFVCDVRPSPFLRLVDHESRAKDRVGLGLKWTVAASMWPLAQLLTVLALVRYTSADVDLSLTYDPTITITPSRLRIDRQQAEEGGEIMIICHLGGSVIDSRLERILLKKSDWKRPNETSQETSTIIARAIRGANGWIPPAEMVLQTLKGSRITGDVKRQNMEVHLSQTHCSDSGTYYCEYLISDSKTSREFNETCNATFAMTVTPVPVDMFMSSQQEWTAGKVLTLTCRALTGAIDPDSQVTWTWKYQNDGERNWQTYTSDISTFDLKPGPGDIEACYFPRITILQRVLTTEDTKRKYGCFVTSNAFASPKSDQMTVGTVTEKAGVSEDSELTSPPSTATVDAEVGSYDTEPGPTDFAGWMRIATVSVCSVMVMLAIGTAITIFWSPKARQGRWLGPRGAPPQQRS